MIYKSNDSLQAFSLPTVENQKSKNTVVKISASEHANQFKGLLRFLSGLKDSWRLVAQSMGVTCPGVTWFPEVSSHKTWDITQTVECTYKAPGIFHCGLDYWEPDGTIAIAPSQDFYHRDFERKFPLNQHTFLQTEVTCSHVKTDTFENVIIGLVKRE